MLDSYFSEQKDLFMGFGMEQLEKDWIGYPVLHFDLSTFKNCRFRFPREI